MKQADDAEVFHPEDNSHRSETIGWILMVGLAFLVFEMTADSSLAVVLGCMKFGTPDLRVARWLRRADPDHVRGCACSWFYIVLAILRIGFMACIIIFVFVAVAGAGIPQRQLERHLISAVLVIFACFAGAALASWMAVGSSLRGGIRVWLDATTKSATKRGLWPPLVPEYSRRADLGPGLIVAYAVFTGLIALFAVSLIAVGVTGGLGAPAVMLGIVFSVICAGLGLAVTPSALWRIEAEHPRECYPEFYVHPESLA
jgi:hypothetical protein